MGGERKRAGKYGLAKWNKRPTVWLSLAHRLYEWASAEEWRFGAALEKPEGRIVDFLLDHGVVVYPVNPSRWTGHGTASV